MHIFAYFMCVFRRVDCKLNLQNGKIQLGYTQVCNLCKYKQGYVSQSEKLRRSGLKCGKSLSSLAKEEKNFQITRICSSCFLMFSYEKLILFFKLQIILLLLSECLILIFIFSLSGYEIFY